MRIALNENWDDCDIEIHDADSDVIRGKDYPIVEVPDEQLRRWHRVLGWPLPTPGVTG